MDEPWAAWTGYSGQYRMKFYDKHSSIVDTS